MRHHIEKNWKELSTPEGEKKHFEEVQIAQEKDMERILLHTFREHCGICCYNPGLNDCKVTHGGFPCEYSFYREQFLKRLLDKTMGGETAK